MALKRSFTISVCFYFYQILCTWAAESGDYIASRHTADCVLWPATVANVGWRPWTTLEYETLDEIRQRYFRSF